MMAFAIEPSKLRTTMSGYALESEEGQFWLRAVKKKLAVPRPAFTLRKRFTFSLVITPLEVL